MMLYYNQQFIAIISVPKLLARFSFQISIQNMLLVLKGLGQYIYFVRRLNRPQRKAGRCVFYKDTKRFTCHTK